MSFLVIHQNNWNSIALPRKQRDAQRELHIESYVKPYFDTNNEIGYNEFFDHDSLHAKGFLNPNLGGGGGGGNFTPPVGFPLITQKQ